MHDLTKKRLSDILTQCIGLRIGVIGDLALDAYWHADMTRAFLSRETPHFPRPVVRERYTCGAGANVAHNLKELGVDHVTVFSVFGDDWRGTLLQRVMVQHGIDCSQLLMSSERFTTAYIKPILAGYESQQEDARIDFENNEPLSQKLEHELLDTVEQNIAGLDALLVADQLEVNGIVTNCVRKGLNALASAYQRKLFVVDSRLRIGAFEHMVLKPNKIEAMGAMGSDINPDSASYDDLVMVAEELHRRTKRPVFLTLGEHGVLVYAETGIHHIPAGPTIPPLDPVGAGDTFISALAGTLAVGGSPWEAGVIANLAAAVTVEKLNQTGTASPDEILTKYDSIA